MKFSWIVVFGLCALTMAVGSHALAIYMESKIRSNQLECVSGRMVELTALAKGLEHERAGLLSSLQERASQLVSIRAELVEEKKTHAPLRQQIERMNDESEKLEQHTRRMESQISSLKHKLEDERNKVLLAGSIEQEMKNLQAEFDAYKTKSEQDRSVFEAQLSDRVRALKKELAADRKINDDLKKKLRGVEGRLKEAVEAVAASSRAVDQVVTGILTNAVE